MRYGVSLPNFGGFADPGALIELATAAEDAGWDGFFLWDHMQFMAGAEVAVADPWVTLAAIAHATERVRIGPLVTPVSRRRPTKLARETVTLDHLSGGRLIFGVGLGAPPDADFADLGEEADPRRRSDMLDEGLSVIGALWSGEPVTHRGTYYRLSNARFLPRPVQRPRIPIWVAGYWPNRRPFRRMARWDGMFPILLDSTSGEEVPTSPHQLAEMVAYVMDHRSDHDSFDVVLAGATPPDRDEAAEIVAPYAAVGLTWWIDLIQDAPFSSVEDWRRRIESGPPAFSPH